MKLSAGIDLASLRVSALVTIDQSAALGLMAIAALHVVHTTKVAQARAALAGHEPHAALRVEAAERNVDVGDLCRTIVANHAARADEIMAFEADRQSFKAAVAAARDQHAINLIVDNARRAFLERTPSAR